MVSHVYSDIDILTFCSHITVVPNYNFLIKFKLLVQNVIKHYRNQGWNSDDITFDLIMLNASNEKAVQVSWENPFCNSQSWSHQRNVGIWVIACGLKWAVPEAKIIRLQYLKFGVEWFLNMQTWTWTGWETRMVWKQIWRKH